MTQHSIVRLPDNLSTLAESTLAQTRGEAATYVLGIDDWSSIGLRTGLSGTGTLDNMRMPKTHPMPRWKGYAEPSADGGLNTSADDTCTLRAMCDLGLSNTASVAALDVIGFAAVEKTSARTVANAQIKTAESKSLLTGRAFQAASGSMRAPVPYMTVARWKYAMLGNRDLKHPLLTLN